MSLDRVELEKMSLPELAAAYNKLTGERIKRFSDRKSGLRRVLAALGTEPDAPAPKEAAATPAAEPERSATPQPKPAAAPAPAPAQEAQEKAAKPRTLAARAGEVKPPRPESKRGQLLVALRTPEGISVEEMMLRFEWKQNDCGDALRLLAKQNGIGTERGADGRWRVI